MLLVTVTRAVAAYFGITKKKTIINSTKYPTEATQLSIIGAVTDDKDAYTAQYMTFCPVARGA